jgi:23S rRNA (cytidine1920-2'-O)/16S rRNA (cytidine1409-2'-O)-methyltransferase
MASTRERLDVTLVARGLAETRAQAQGLILAGRVKVDGQPSDKAGRAVDGSAVIEVSAPPRFVSRGGEKLLGAIDHFGLSFEGRRVLDVGASTGGFTDCALQHGAVHVTCVDVGRAQLHHRLRVDPRVVSIEQLNARLLKPGDLPHDQYDRIVMDLSFISLRSVLPAIWPFCREGGLVVALVKPQFEAGREEVSKGRGVVRDERVRQAALAAVRASAQQVLPGCLDRGAIDCPLSGADGNREFLLLLEKASVASV